MTDPAVTCGPATTTAALRTADGETPTPIEWTDAAIGVRVACVLVPDEGWVVIGKDPRCGWRAEYVPFARLRRGRAEKVRLIGERVEVVIRGTGYVVVLYGAMSAEDRVEASRDAADTFPGMS